MALQGLDNLTRSLSRLPGVGRRSAERMAMKLAADPEGLILPLIGALEETRRTISFCSRCGAMTAVENDPCRLCTDSKRDGRVVCVVEDPSDIVAMETTGSYTGRYHALMGKISPMRGDGPNDIRIADSLCHAGSPIASKTKLRVTLALQAEPELTRTLAASNKSIISFELNPGIEKVMVVATEFSKL